MISTKFEFIFTHPPKTGGNSLTKLLLPYCDDQLHLRDYQDGVDTFGVLNEYSLKKHAKFQDYVQQMGNAAKKFAFAMSVRHPFPRAVSYYFSPHRWYRELPEGGWASVEPKWSEVKFLELLDSGELSTMHSFIEGQTFIERRFLIRTESMKEDLGAFVDAVGIPRVIINAIPRLNKTAAKNNDLNKVFESVDLKNIVEQRYYIDMNYFNYPTFRI